VLVDWKMPDAQGLDLAFRIRDRKSAASPTKIVLLTPFGDEALNRGAVTERLDGCLSKPVSESSLMDTLKMAFGDRPEAGVISDAQGRSDSPPGLSGRRVLLVEDNEYNQIVAAELLTDVAGAVVTVARNGQEAVERARAERFDVALMDIQMPIMDGYQAAALIRADAQTANMPIIAMTAHAMARDRERCLAAGMNDYITKPLHPREFFGVLAKWIGGAEPVAGPRRATVVEAIEPAVARATPSVSFALGLHRCVGRVDLYERILDRFLNSRLSEPADIRHALDRADLKQAARIAHSSISTAGTIGANGLSDCARELQLAIDAGDADRWPELVDTFARQHAVVASDIRRYFAEKPSV
jgi:two-component system sensor histidine kinase/response regulator